MTGAPRDGRPPVLLVDDEQNVLDAVHRTLRGRFALTSTSDPARAVELLRSDGSFKVIVSDLRMPGMSGVELLAEARRIAPSMVRILLTGYADVETSLAAVNEGQVFRFLTKPVDAPTLGRSIDAAVEQHDLVVAERVLLRETLHGAVRALTELLSLANPQVFGRATMIRMRATEIAERLGVEDDWAIGVAAMLSQIGTLTLAHDTVRKLHAGRPLADNERRAVDEAPAVVERLLGNIPRLEPVLEILARQDARFRPGGEALPLGARILKATSDFAVLESQGRGHEAAISEMRARDGCYDPEVLEALAAVMSGERSGPRECQVRLSDVSLGDRLDEDLVADSGVLLLTRGQEVNPAILARIHNSWADVMGDRLLSVVRT